MKRTLLIVSLALIGCAAGNELSDAERARIASEVETALRDAYDLARPDVAERMLALYPSTGDVVSANAGRVQRSRDSLEAGIRYFWENVGVNMRNPRWVWDSFHTDVLARDAAVVTATYHIPHLNPRGLSHVLGGAMTAVFARRGGRWVIIQEHLSDTPQQQTGDSSNAH